MFYLSSVLRKRLSPVTTPQGSGGFGLIELLVSISIMAIVSAVIFTRQSSFNSSVLLRNEAYKIALQARDVQLSAVSALGSAGGFRSVHGIQFDTANTNRYNIFIDANTNGYFDSLEEFGQQGIINSDFQIKAIRVVGDTLSGSSVSVIFVRPNFDARFVDPNKSSGNKELTAATSVEIDIGQGAIIRTVEITSTGQITVK